MFRFVFVGVALSLGLSAYGADPRASDVEDARSALKRFNSTPKFLSEDPQRETLRDDLLSQCEIGDAQACLRQLLAKPRDAVRAVGDNPAYWEAFEAVVAQPALYAGAEVSFSDRQDGYHVHNVLEAIQGQFYREIARTKGRIDIERFLDRYRDYRRHSMESERLVQRMIFAAAIGIAHHQMEMLLPVLAARNDFDAIDLIGRALTPFSREERSLRRTMAGEHRWMLEHFSTLEQIDRETFPNPELLPLGDLEELKAWLIEVSAAEGERIVAHLGAISERSWTDFWRLGFGGTETHLPTEDEALTVYFSDAYRAYVSTARSLEVPLYPMQALVDVYAERAPLGLPQRQAPPLWDWNYETDPERICLLPTGVQTGLGDFSAEMGACVRYVDPQLVYGWLD